MKQQATASGPMTEEEDRFAFPAQDSAVTLPVEEKKAPVRYLREVTKRVELDFPMEFEGTVHEVILIENMPIGVFRKHLEAGGSNQIFDFPMFKTPDGEPVPKEIMHSLMFSDAEAVREVAEGFLSRKSRAGDSQPAP